MHHVEIVRVQRRCRDKAVTSGPITLMAAPRRPVDHAPCQLLSTTCSEEERIKAADNVVMQHMMAVEPRVYEPRGRGQRASAEPVVQHPPSLDDKALGLRKWYSKRSRGRRRPYTTTPGGPYYASEGANVANLHDVKGDRASRASDNMHGKASSSTTAMAPPMPLFRAAVMTSRRHTSRHAHERVRVRRRIRATLRHHLPPLALDGWDYVVLASIGALTADFGDLSNHVKEAIVHIHRVLAPHMVRHQHVVQTVAPGTTSSTDEK